MRTRLLSLAPCIALTLLLAHAPPASAAQGVVDIDQAAAKAGGITPGDAPDWPIFITRSGSYRLTSDLVIDRLDHASVIVILADNVTIDFNGFGIYGPNRCKSVGPFGITGCTVRGLGHGVTTDLQARSVKLRNGQIRGMAGAGISLPTADAHISDMVVTHSGGMGVDIKSGTLRNNSSQFNASEGFVARGAAIATGNQAIGNGTDGLHFYAGTGSLATGNQALRNGRYGIAVTHSASAGVGGNVMHENALGNLFGSVFDMGGNAQ